MHAATLFTRYFPRATASGLVGAVTAGGGRDFGESTKNFTTSPENGEQHERHDGSRARAR